MSLIAPLSDAQCAAVFLMLLEDEEAAGLLGHLQPEELELVGSIMCSLEDIEPGKVADAIAGFIAEAETEGLPARDRQQQVGALLTQAVGEVKGESLMQRIAPDTAPRSIEIARWLAPGILLAMIEEEHPQVIAILLLMLDPETAASILASLPPETQPQVVERIARLGNVPNDAIAMLDQLLSSRITRRFGSAALALGGAREAANLINLSEPEVARQVLPEIERKDADLAKAIEAEMFTFEMLLELDAQGMGRLLRDVENQDLITALKGLDEENQTPFFAAMSSRAADGVRDEMELLPKLRRADVQTAQKTIVDLARKLADDGEISLGASDGEFI
ncbi:flagellar motor switch protein FliG [Parerythrobacter jejuensis]|uniref:Flagellar motor switch protein FliG n=1 Tax=Parerythrobacter jejuensis TaxID=795812 RepID=A0A845AIT8_9SPHN|nr:flagellar motor switch protein FliG [Parerythrobacter jejuensis]MXP30612.1 flagellar motor switch protein FliG [Parerythrobacter jejuensis]MXP33372.1 flagellar motor switch protein FliG [Parerythrobacter jejuensis]